MTNTLLRAFSLVILTSSPAFAATVPVNGEIKKINEAQGKITIKHGPITNLDMGAMTMVFTVADPKFLTDVEVGDKVTFEADRVKGKLTVLSITATE